MSASNSPVSFDRLEKIAQEACSSAFANATTYVHSKVESWNSSIINDILENIVSAASSESTAPQYKYAVNSTIVQHLSSETSTTTSQTTQTASPPSSPPSGAALGANEADARDSETPVQGTTSDERSVRGGSKSTTGGRRGMHSATGAYWNNETDGMWNFKYEAGENKGMDVVISVIWVAV